MKKINSSYYEFFFYRYGVIVLAIHLVMIPITLIYKEKDIPLLACVTIPSFFFLFLICFSEYRRLKKNIKLANVAIDGNDLLINEISYSPEQIDGITSLSVRNALDKFYIFLVEIKTTDGEVFHCLDKRLNWKFESPTERLLIKNASFSLKVKASRTIENGFTGLNHQK